MKSALRAGLALVALTATLTGCGNIPYRIEFGRKKDTDPTPNAAPGGPAGGSGPTVTTAKTAALHWESVHRDLERIFEDRRRSPGPVPHETFDRCRRAVDRLASLLPEQASVFDEARTRYDAAEAGATQGKRAALTLSRLKVVARDLRAALE